MIGPTKLFSAKWKKKALFSLGNLRKLEHFFTLESFRDWKKLITDEKYTHAYHLHVLVVNGINNE